MKQGAGGNLPLINLIEYAHRLRWPMLFLKILLDPGDKVVLESAFDRLME